MTLTAAAPTHATPGAQPVPTTTTSLRIVTIDPNAVLRAGLPLLFPELDFVAEFGSVDAMLAQRPEADVVLMEICTPATSRLSGAEGVRALARAGYLVCVFTWETRHTVLERCLTAGARGILQKTEMPALLQAALQRVAGGGTALGTGLSRILTRPSCQPLTTRQRDVLIGRARGETFHSIARRLGISERTAQDHWSAIARRYERFLRTHSATDLERSLGLDGGAVPLPAGDEPRLPSSRRIISG